VSRRHCPQSELQRLPPASFKHPEPVIYESLFDKFL